MLFVVPTCEGDALSVGRPCGSKLAGSKRIRREALGFAAGHLHEPELVNGLEDDAPAVGRGGLPADEFWLESVIANWQRRICHLGDGAMDVHCEGNVFDFSRAD